MATFTVKRECIICREPVNAGQRALLVRNVHMVTGPYHDDNEPYRVVTNIANAKHSMLMHEACVGEHDIVAGQFRRAMEMIDSQIPGGDANEFATNYVYHGVYGYVAEEGEGSDGNTD